VICGSSHILEIEITTFFRKMNYGFFTSNSRYLGV
ncbi:hypothetical protein LEP1GSC150_0050, partial [Leptospira interrogans serovar Copenhageni str. LT2050]